MSEKRPYFKPGAVPVTVTVTNPPKDWSRPMAGQKGDYYMLGVEAAGTEYVWFLDVGKDVTETVKALRPGKGDTLTVCLAPDKSVSVKMAGNPNPQRDAPVPASRAPEPVASAAAFDLDRDIAFRVSVMSKLRTYLDQAGLDYTPESLSAAATNHLMDWVRAGRPVLAENDRPPF